MKLRRALPTVGVLAAGGTAAAMHLALRQVRDYDEEAFPRSLRGDMARYAPPLREAAEKNRQLRTETVTLAARDGERLRGEFYPAEGKARGTILLVHGYRSSWRCDFSMAVPLYHELGWNELLIDQRAQGGSGGREMGLGVLERYDVADWAWWLAGRFPGEPIVLGGMSMGATSVLMACALPLPEEVRGVVADCGFTSPEEIVRWLLSRRHKAGAALLPLCRLLARPALGYGLRDASTLEALAQSDLPLLLIHGEADYFVPCEMSRRNYEASAAADKTLLTVPGATHGMSFMVDRERCTRALEDFLERVAPPDA